jgi:glycosyltransferase involved in cell wall biosynthesis
MAVRYGWDLYTPTGRGWWDERYWRFGDVFGDDRLARQYLDHDDPIDSEFPDWPVQFVTLDDARAMDWDFVIASVPENEQGFARFAKEVGAQYVLQVGNTGQWIDWSLDPLAIVSSEMPIEGRGIVYHQPMDPIAYIPPPDPMGWAASFVNSMAEMGECWALLEMARQEIPIALHGNGPHATNIKPFSDIITRMGAVGWGWHDKAQGDGFGHVIHAWAAVGRPLVGHASHYRGRMAERFWRDGETCIDLDRHSLTEAINIMRTVTPEKHRAMCEAIRAEFDLIDWEAEAEAVGDFLGVTERQGHAVEENTGRPVLPGLPVPQAHRAPSRGGPGMRLLFWGDMGSTGFGTVTRDLGSALIAKGVDVRFISWNEDGHELAEPFKSRTLIIGGKNGWLGPTPTFARDEDSERWAKMQQARLRSLFTALPDGWKPDAGFVTSDPAGVIRSGLLELVPDTLPIYHYVPIEGTGLPPSWTAIWQKMKPIAMSEFGAIEIEKLTGTKPPFIYHGVSSEFFPASSTHPIMLAKKAEWLRSKADCKRHIGIDPKATVLFRADRFVPRKRFGAMLRAVAAVMLRRPEVILLLHCRTLDDGGNLVDFISHLPPAIGRRIHSTGIHDAGHVADRKLLNIMYNAADIYVSTGAEGFGLTIAEALAAGTPAIGLDYSSVPEVIGPAGVTVPVGQFVENEYAFWWASPDEAKYAQALDTLVTDVRTRRLLGAEGPRHVAGLSWDKAADELIEIAQLREAVAA